MICGCFTNCFYIKPQLGSCIINNISVALLIVSTSNRNPDVSAIASAMVALLIVSTSNRNFLLRLLLGVSVALLIVSTSNRN